MKHLKNIQYKLSIRKNSELYKDLYSLSQRNQKLFDYHFDSPSSDKSIENLHTLIYCSLFNKQTSLENDQIYFFTNYIDKLCEKINSDDFVHFCKLGQFSISPFLVEMDIKNYTPYLEYKSSSDEIKQLLADKVRILLISGF